VKDQVSHPDRTTGAITVLILIFRFFERAWQNEGV
jgi:hypothetical protein